MFKIIIVASWILFAANANAATKQIEIIGLVPGVSTQEQVNEKKDGIYYMIGGYRMWECKDEYIDNRLSYFLCPTGGVEENPSVYSTDITKHNVGTNTQVHSDFVKGFTTKFGKPTKTINSVVRNGRGTEFKNQEVIWVDKKGNRLTLTLMENKVSVGSIEIISAEAIKADEDATKKADQQRKF